jgi:hypothetical protein
MANVPPAPEGLAQEAREVLWEDPHKEGSALSPAGGPATQPSLGEA